MKKLLISTTLVVAGVLAIGGYVYHQFDKTLTKSEAYLNAAAKVPGQVMQGYKELNVFTFRDRPGLGGAMGKQQAEEIAAYLEAEEKYQYEDLKKSTFFSQVEPDVINCAAKVHADNLKQIRQLKSNAKAFVTNLQEMHNQLDNLEDNVLEKFQCYSLFESYYPYKALGIKHDT